MLAAMQKLSYFSNLLSSDLHVFLQVAMSVVRFLNISDIFLVVHIHVVF